MKTLVKRLYGKNSGIYTVKDGRRTRLSDCETKIEIYEETKRLPSLGGGSIKKYTVAVALCGGIDAEEDDIKDVSAFDVVTDLKRLDGIYERIFLDNLSPVEIDLFGDWTFEIADRKQIYNLVGF